MIPELRKRFNDQWTPEKHAAFTAGIEAASGTPVGFRCSETPVFLPEPLVRKMSDYGRELYGQLASNQEYRHASETAIPHEFRVPNEPEHPLFVQADFGLVREHNGAIEPKLVEIQGFPSLYGFQLALADEYRRAYSLDANLESLLGGLNAQSYWDLLRTAILGGYAPEEVVLMEIDPYRQKTLCDFLVTQRMLGIQIASVTEIEKRGRQLYFNDKRIRRIYNRVIADELLRNSVQLPFSFRDDLDIEWAGHPNWFFRLSKFSLPWFRHVCVPKTWFLHDVADLPQDLENYVLKPLYSFAGLGVKIAPSVAEIESIPSIQRSNYILQEKMDFIPTVNTPAGPTKIEVRIMYVWQGELKPVTTIVRSGRGKMMGVDFNKNLDWVGASAGFYPPR